MGDISKNFNRSEFDCGCGCGKDNISPLVVKYCQMIRDALGTPLNIESGVRCQQHNDRQPGSVPNSAHIMGLAADISSPGMSNRELGLVIKSLFYAGKMPTLKYCYLIKGRTNTGVHFDVDKSKAAKRGGRIFAF